MKLAINGGEKTVTIPFPHFKWPILDEEIKKAIIEYLDNQPISLYGREGIYKELEDKFAEYHNVKYAIATNSGTTALHSAFFGIGIKPNDEIIAPTYTFLATVTPILHCGGIPIFCDAEFDTGNIDVDKIEEKITDKTKAIVINHQWGHPVEMDKLMKIKEKYNLFLVEDCSHAHGATYKGKKVGTFGDVACFSLQGNKMITAGEGGILITDNQEIYERATLLGHYRNRSEQCVKSEFYKRFVKTGYGLKYRMHPLGAVIASKQFDNLDKWNKMRKECLEYLSEGLKKIKGIEPPVTKDYVTRGAFYGYKPKFKPEDFDNRISINKYVKALQAEGVDIDIPGSKPLHMLPLFQIEDDGMYGFKKKIYKKGDFPVAEKYYSTLMSMPTFTLPSSKEIIDQYLKAFKKVGDYYEELL
jgi:dTDP-4-amino-4,6-dideoxygalactose transaminase